MVRTLVPKNLVKIGFEFKFAGEQEACKKCKLRGICVENLKPDRYYKIIEIKDSIHECKAFDMEMREVEVEEVDPLLIIEASDIKVKDTIKVEKIKCNNEKCNYYYMCNYPLFSEGDKVEVTAIEKDIICPLNRRLILIRGKRKRAFF